MATAKFYGADQSALQQWFSVVDADRSGEVNTAELQQALAQGGLNFSMKLASSMIRMFDDDRNAQLRFDEFVKLHAYLVNCQRTFARADEAPPRQPRRPSDAGPLLLRLQPVCVGGGPALRRPRTRR